jgi:hypothetical protein
MRSGDILDKDVPLRGRLSFTRPMSGATKKALRNDLRVHEPFDHDRRISQLVVSMILAFRWQHRQVVVARGVARL